MFAQFLNWLEFKGRYATLILKFKLIVVLYSFYTRGGVTEAFY